MSAEGFVVISVGCLECGNVSDLLGVYPSVAEALAAHPEAKLRSDMQGGDGWAGDWWGEDVTVIFDLAAPSGASTKGPGDSNE